MQLEGLVASPACFTSSDEYLPEGCLALKLDLAEAVNGWSDLQPGERGALAFELCNEVIRQYAATIGGLVRGVHKHRWDQVSRVEFSVRPGEAGQRWLVETAQAQSLLVQRGGQSVHIPATVAAARLPPAHAQVEFRGVPFYYSKPGFAAAFLRGAGYSREQGVEVVHERAGIVLGPNGERLEGAPALDVVVAVVRTPAGVAGLPNLPAGVRLGGVEIEVSVEGPGVGIAASFVRRRAA